MQTLVFGCRYNGVTAYQTDWAIAAVTLRAEGSPLEPEDHTAFNLPMASLQGQPGGQSRFTHAALCLWRFLMASSAPRQKHCVGRM